MNGLEYWEISEKGLLPVIEANHTYKNIYIFQEDEAPFYKNKVS